MYSRSPYSKMPYNRPYEASLSLVVTYDCMRQIVEESVMPADTLRYVVDDSPSNYDLLRAVQSIMVSKYELNRSILDSYISTWELRRRIVVEYHALFDVLRESYFGFELVRNVAKTYQQDFDTRRMPGVAMTYDSDLLRVVHKDLQEAFELLRRIRQVQTRDIDIFRHVVKEYVFEGDTEREIPAWQGLYNTDTLRRIWEVQIPLHGLLREIEMTPRYKRTNVIGGRRYWPITYRRKKNQ